MSDLVITPVTPRLRQGRGIRTFGVIAALARHGDVDVFYTVFEGAQPAPEYAALGNVTMHPLHSSRGPARALAYLQARRRGVPSDYARGVTGEVINAAQRAPSEVRLIADGPIVAAALLGLASKREIVYLAHNLESGFRTQWGAGDLEHFERNVVESFAECWMATRSDMRGAQELAGKQVNVRYVPNVVDVSKIRPVSPSGLGAILFVADFTYEPNREGLRFLVDEVLPLVWDRRPDVRLTAVGRGLTATPRDPRVQTPGFVEDLGGAYAAADVIAVPLLHGGGSPLKFMEGLASGLPVVATRHAARLVEDGVAGEHFLAAATAAEFAAALESVLGDPVEAAAIGAAGRALADRSYSIDALARLLGERQEAGHH
jgi:glycosyltransferase involved in cell wall biosynthesis